jgi:hypothetical protein
LTSGLLKRWLARHRLPLTYPPGMVRLVDGIPQRVYVHDGAVYPVFSYLDPFGISAEQVRERIAELQTKGEIKS